jgi:hypothetical protein
MGEVISAIVALVAIGGMVWLYVHANRSIKAQRGNRMMKRSHEERDSIRESRYRMGDGGGGGIGMG